MQDAKEEVRSRLNIEDVVGEYVQLKRAGRNFKGLSPFTSEKTPSFTVSPDKHIWHDFSSGKGGDVFSFVMEVEGLDFRGALELLARKAGVELEQYDTKRSGEIAKKKKRLLEASELAARYYQQSLLRNHHALEYVFKTRGLDKRVVQDFRIGYAPDEGKALISALEKKGFSKQELSNAGLTNRYGGDIFRGRMTVPLMDTSGQVVGFTGRILEDEPNAPKYLNTPATLIYDKSRHVFGLSQAKEAIRKEDRAVIVEGNLDVVSSHQGGVKNVVATAGTAMTEWHLKSLSRLSQNITLAFDSDKAGLAATERAIPIAGKVGVELTIVSLPGEAKDPDELIRQDVKLWKKAIAEAAPAVNWVLEQYSSREDMASAAGKRRFTTESLAVIRRLDDAVEREHYLKQVAAMTDTSLEAVQAKFAAPAEEPVRAKKRVVPAAGDTTTINFNTQADNLLAVAYLNPGARNLLAGAGPEPFDRPGQQALASFLRSHTGNFPSALPKDLLPYETYVKIVELKAETRYGNWTDTDLQLEAARLLRLITTEQRNKTKLSLTSELREAETLGDEARANELRAELAKLIKETARG